MNWKNASYRELIDYVINKHHRYLNEVLPQLSPYLTKVLRVHGANQPHLAQIHKLFHKLKMELEQLLIKEETEDFPLILASEQNTTDENYTNIQEDTPVAFIEWGTTGKQRVVTGTLSTLEAKNF